MEDSPIIKMRKFFSHEAKPVEMAEFMSFYKACSDVEKAEFKASVERWDGKSNFIPIA